MTMESVPETMTRPHVRTEMRLVTGTGFRRFIHGVRATRVAVPTTARTAAPAQGSSSPPAKAGSARSTPTACPSAPRSPKTAPTTTLPSIASQWWFCPGRVPKAMARTTPRMTSTEPVNDAGLKRSSKTIALMMAAMGALAAKRIPVRRGPIR